MDDAAREILTEVAAAIDAIKVLCESQKEQYQQVTALALACSDVDPTFAARYTKHMEDLSKS